MRIIGNFSADWDLERIHVNPRNECLTDKATNAKPLTMVELIEALFEQRRHGRALDDLMCKHCDAGDE